MYQKIITSPIGNLQLVASDAGLRAVNFDGKFWDNAEEKPSHHILLKAEKQLGEYFAGKRKEFEIKLEMRGTVFQINAWRILQKIPYGETVSYGQQAAQIGDSKKARPIGVANSRNPIPIIVPCHRVVGASGALTGYAGGLAIKQFLLDLEAIVI